jgi:predicted nucleotidyltransferase
MKYFFTYILTLLLGLSHCYSQVSFLQVTPPPPALQNKADFNGVTHSSIVFGDIDNDNDNDLLITGNSFNGATSTIYENDSMGNFSEVSTPFLDGVQKSSVAFEDVDGDNDLDLLITGLNHNGQEIAKLYKNNGSGAFAPPFGGPFTGVQKSSIAFEDIDGDNDPDVLITGLTSTGQSIAELYTNDSLGNFTLVTGTPFVGVHNSAIVFEDIDNDNDPDVLITGENASGTEIANLYLNNGNGVFTFRTTPFDGVKESSVAFEDVDGDNDLDLLITGINSSNQAIATFYTNFGNGNFLQTPNTSVNGVFRSSIDFADIDGDNDVDLIISGRNSSANRTTELYTNNGTGSFTIVLGTNFNDLRYSSIKFEDVDNDNDPDLILTGEGISVQRVANLFINDGTGSFTMVKDSPLEGVLWSSTAAADVDGDTDLDLIISGINTSNQIVTNLYTNDGSGNYTIVNNTPFDGIQSGSIAMADVDGDGDNDVLITGVNPSNLGIAKLYLNNGTGIFTQVLNTPFDGVRNSSIAFEDIDGDNDLDVLITGANNSQLRTTKLYRNGGLGNFTLITGTTFDLVFFSSVAFADIDGDNDADILITGRVGFNNKVAKLYKNNGTGIFTLVNGTPFDGVDLSSISFADIDGDNDEDVLITGTNNSNTKISKLYRNDGIGNFLLINNTIFDGVNYSSIAFADVDKDNDLDVLITGTNTNNTIISKMYLNDSTGTFTLLNNSPFDPIWLSSVKFLDIDNDSDLDVLISGGSIRTSRISKIYKNTSCFATLNNVTITVCDSNYTWSLNGITYSNSGVYLDTILNSGGCDSILSLDLTLALPTTSFNSISACGSYFWPTNNQTYTMTGNYFDTISNSVGCDSIISLILTVNSLPIANAGPDQNICNGSTIQIGGAPTGPVGSTFSWDNSSSLSSNSVSNPLANPTSTTTYTVTVTNLNGCTSINQMTLTVNSPTANVNVQTACNIYTWMQNGNTYNSSGLYKDTLQNSVGCDSIITLDLTIDTINSSVTQNGLVLTSNQSGATYQWLDCVSGLTPISGATSQIYTAPINGAYAVIISKNSCVDTSVCISTFTIGIDKLNNQNEFKIYPNPAKKSFTIDLGNNSRDKFLQIFNLSGKLIKKQKIDLNREIVDISSFSVGIYILKYGSNYSKLIVN